MIYSIARKMAKHFIEIEIIDFDDYEVCIFGLEILMYTSLKAIGLMVLAILTRNIVEMAVFLTFFCTLRYKAGGYHAKTALNCFAIMTTFSFSSIYISKYLVDKVSVAFMIGILGVSIAMMYRIGPRGTKNIQLKKEDEIIRKKQMLIIAILQSMIIIISQIMLHELNEICLIATFAMFIESLTLIKIQGGNENEEENV